MTDNVPYVGLRTLPDGTLMRFFVHWVCVFWIVSPFTVCCESAVYVYIGDVVVIVVVYGSFCSSFFAYLQVLLLTWRHRSVSPIKTCEHLGLCCIYTRPTCTSDIHDWLVLTLGLFQYLKNVLSTTVGAPWYEPRTYRFRQSFLWQCSVSIWYLLMLFWNKYAFSFRFSLAFVFIFTSYEPFTVLM